MDNIDILKSVLSEKYNIIQLIARGGMGEIYLATHRILGKKLAIKVIRQQMKKDAEVCQRFLLEARLAACLDHPNIIQISDYGSHPEFDYLVMPYIEGQTLHEKLKSAPFATDEALNIMIPIAEAISYAHKKNIIHRDIKPSNFLISDTGRILLTDFGISKHIGSATLTMAHQVLGTPKYMSPEQITGKTVSKSSDLYSLGIIFYQLVTGRYPFDTDAVESLTFMHLYTIPKHPTEINPNVPAELGSIIIKLLEKDPNKRYPDGESLLTDLMLQKTDFVLLNKAAGVATGRPLPSGGASLDRDVTTRKLGRQSGDRRRDGEEEATAKADMSIHDMPTAILISDPDASCGPPDPVIAFGYDADAATPSPQHPSPPKQNQTRTLAAASGICALILLLAAFLAYQLNIGNRFLTTTTPAVSPKPEEPAPPAPQPRPAPRLRDAQARVQDRIRRFNSLAMPLSVIQARHYLQLKVGVVADAPGPANKTDKLNRFLAELPFIEPVADGDCDVLISTALESDKIRISSNLYEPTGDIGEEADASPDAACFQKLQGFLLRNYCFQAFDTLKHLNRELSGAGITLEAWGKTTARFFIDDMLQFCLQPDFEAHCMILDINFNGIFRLYPISAEQQAKVPAGKSECSMDIKVAPPLGNEMIVAIGAARKDGMGDFSAGFGSDASIFQWSFDDPKASAVDLCERLFMSLLQSKPDEWAVDALPIRIVAAPTPAEVF